MCWIDLGQSSVTSATLDVLDRREHLAHSHINLREPRLDIKLPDPELSPVILEDFTRPPESVLEDPPMYLSPSEFFKRISCDKWEGKSSYRVIGGELLLLLIQALHEMESTFLINAHVLHANLNNRQKEGAKGWRYEKIVVRIVFYDKADSSNIPLQILEETEPYATPRVTPVRREISQIPYAHTQHCVNHVRLVDGEGQSNKQELTKQELQRSIMRRLNVPAEVPKPVNEKPPAKEKDNPRFSDPSKKAAPVEVYTETVDLIAESPTLVSTDTKSKPAKSEDKVVKSTIDQELPGHLALFTSDPTTLLPSTTIMPGIEEAENELNIPSTSTDSFSVVVTADFQSSEANLPVYKTLNLTRNELYVTGLYEPRDENRISTKEKLQCRKKRRSKMYDDILDNLKSKSGIDLSCSFKSLAVKKEMIRRKSMAPRVPSRVQKTESLPRGSARESTWDPYLRDRHNCEMEIALKNPLEEGIQERLRLLVLMPKVEEPKQEVKGAKPGKPNRSQNAFTSENNNTNQRKRNQNVSSCQEMTMESLDTHPYGLMYTNMRRVRNLPSYSVLNKSMNSRASDADDEDDSYSQLLDLLTTWRQNVDTGVRLRSRQLSDFSVARLQNQYYLTNSRRDPADEKRIIDRMIRETRNQRHMQQHTGDTANTSGHPGDTANTSGHPGSVNSFPKPFTAEALSKLTNKTSGAKPKLDLPQKTKCVKHQRTDSVKDVSDTTFNSSYPMLDDTANKNLLDDKANKNLLDETSNKNMLDDTANRTSNASKTEFDVSSYSTSTTAAGASVSTRESPQIRDIKPTVSRKASTPKGDRLTTPAPITPRPTVSEQLEDYLYDCDCAECVLQDPLLTHLRPPPTQRVEGYPLFLGRLRRDFKCLKHRPPAAPKLMWCDVGPYFSRMTSQNVQQQLLRLMCDVMIKKEIISSSLGHSYVTVTFTKPEVAKRMTDFSEFV
ncbi:uncharacterized protein LOC131947713 [Physella acuta]|uniref:uncharacterized protein LOC131947713 n=1 Tax=Physella acuta TaxID=109671 RepID=UPI0027DE7A4E|nr:uncharacterized protein LOC131947713 [Physella acuta]